MTMIPLTIGATGPDVQELHEALTRLGIFVPEGERAGRYFGNGTRDAVRTFQSGMRRFRGKVNGVLDDTTRAGLAAAAESDTGKVRRLEGRILFDHGLPAEDLTLRLYAIGFGGKATRLGATKTGARGWYAFEYPREGAPQNLEVRALRADGKTEVALSAVKVGAARRELWNLVMPSDDHPLDSEYDRLTDALTRALGKSNRLSAAREDAERCDITMLRRATGWDARLITLAAIAARLAEDTKLPAESLYGAFRTGVPATASGLATVPYETFKRALARAAEARIISLTQRERSAAAEAFAAFARVAHANNTASGSLSSFGKLLARSGLSTSGREGPSQADTFQQLVMKHADAPQRLWAEAEKAGIPAKRIETLKLQGKMAYLTRNNLPLMTELQKRVSSPDDMRQLVDHDLDRPEAWKTLIRRVAKGKKGGTDALIPPAYAGDTPAQRLDHYAGDLARRVRMSFPTRVVKQMVARGDIPLGRDANTKSVTTLLDRADALGYRLGREPLGAFVAKHARTLFGRETPREADRIALRHVGRLHRLYQITPNDAALAGAMRLGIRAARDVSSMSADQFVLASGNAFASPEEARLVHRKAQQVTGVTRSVYAMVKSTGSTPELLVVSPPERAKAMSQMQMALSAQYPTLESLFNSLDFCDCEHCRSVLSPAAYLVDLLHYLDPDATAWGLQKAAWLQLNGRAYPYDKPAAELFERRPDLQTLALTCANTNTAMPYIDLVNEILEYAVENGGDAPPESRDTGTATSAELIAEPQFILPAAYDTLRDDATYPIGLPFDLWLETVRAFAARREAPLWRVLEALRPTDALFNTSTSITYDRSAVFMEYLGLSPAEIEILTNRTPLTSWWDLYGYASAAAARTALASARTLSRRLGVTYQELVKLVKAAFVNPDLDALIVLQKMGLTVEQIYRFHGDAAYPAFTTGEHDAVAQTLAEFSADHPGFDAQTWLTTQWNAGAFRRILVLHDPTIACDFSLTTLRPAGAGFAANAMDLPLVKLNLFVRLWRRLGWTIEEVDRALQAFLPSTMRPPTATQLGQAMETALIYISHLQSLTTLVKGGKDARLTMLTFWSDLATTGTAPLYAQLFLTPGVLAADPVFDDPLGRYLTGGALLSAHLPAVQGALGLTADDIDRIVRDTGADPAAVQLTMGTVSGLYRYGLLARVLGHTVRDLITLKELAGNPFTALATGALTTLTGDQPYSSMLRFVELARLVKASGLSVTDLAWILMHRADPTGPYRPKPERTIALVQSLAEGIRRIEADVAVPEAPEELTDDLVRQWLALALPSVVADRFFEMWTGTVVYEAVDEPVTAANALDPAEITDEPAVQFEYDAVRRIQRLRYRGVLLDAERTRLEAAYTSTRYAGLLADVQAQAADWFDEQIAWLVPTLTLDDLFGPPPATADDAGLQAFADDRRRALADAIVPALRARLVRQLASQSVATLLSGDPGLVDALLTDVELLTDPSVFGRPLVGAFAAAAETGVTTECWTTARGVDDGPTNPPSTTVRLDAFDIDAAGVPGTTRSVRLSAFIEVPVTGAYRFVAIPDRADAEAELRFAHLNDPVLFATAAAGGDELDATAFVELQAGVPYRLTLIGRNLSGGDIELRVAGDGLPIGSTQRLTLTPSASVTRVERALLLLEKVLLLTNRLALSPRELAYLLRHPADFDALDWSALPTRVEDDVPGSGAALFVPWSRLARYAALKKELSAGTDDLLTVLESARRPFAADVTATAAEGAIFDAACQAFADLARRTRSAVADVATRLGFSASSAVSGDARIAVVAGFVDERGLVRVWDALRLIEELGASPDTVADWTRIVSRNVPPSDADEIAAAVRAAVKGRYSPAAWRSAAQATFDVLRRKQRDALVAYLVNELGYDRPDDLLGRYLVDALTEPPVLTSRLRLALSSVQLFVQRCLLNLETDTVLPSIIDAERWKWMKRYRVWEANRKIYLFPENWLEPEFRDDKTPLFRELEGTLLQGEASDTLAEDALFAYLRGLEDVARLEVVAMYREDRLTGGPVYHVVGRTHNLPHKYHYRRFDGTWTAWEPISAEIEGDHIAAIVWRQRLHLFWVTFLEKAEPQTNSSTQSVTEMADETSAQELEPKVIIEAQINWSEYFQGEWSPRTAGGFGEPVRVTITDPPFDRNQVFIHATKGHHPDGSDAEVKVHLSGEDFNHLVSRNISAGKGKKTKATKPTVKSNRTAFLLPGRNAKPEVAGRQKPPEHPYSADEVHATEFRGASGLEVNYVRKTETTDSGKVTVDEGWDAILDKTPDYALLLSGNRPSSTADELGALRSPFFYQDRQHSFFVQPRVTEETLDGYSGYVLVDVLEIPEGLNELVEIIALGEIVPDLGYPPEPLIPDDAVVPHGGGPQPDPYPDIHELSRATLKASDDWVIRPETILTVDGWSIDREGGFDRNLEDPRYSMTTVDEGQGGPLP